MKSWQLTLICVPRLKAVLSAVERTQLDFYGIDRNFEELEQELTEFLEAIQKAKAQRGSVYQLENNQTAHYGTDRH